MPLSSEITLNPVPGSVQWDVDGFVINVVGSQNYAAGTPASVYHGAIGDLDGDGWAEIVISGWSYQGWNATGTPPATPFKIFSTGPDGGHMVDPTTFLGRATSPGVQSLRIGDFNGDGLPDLFVAGHNESPFVPTQSTLFLNNGNGTMRAVDTGPKGTYHNGEVGDLNGDGRADFIASAYDTISGAFDPRYYAPGSYQILGNHASIVVFLGQADGTTKALPFGFNQPLDQLAAPGNTTRINWGGGSDSVMADFDGDGKSEIVAVDLGISHIGNPVIGNSWLFTNLQWDENSIWGDPVSLPIPYLEDPRFNDVPSEFSHQRSHDVAVNPFDFDNDGDLDIVIAGMIWTRAASGRPCCNSCATMAIWLLPTSPIRRCTMRIWGRTIRARPTSISM